MADECQWILTSKPASKCVLRCALILLIDNYDSFVHNLARYLRRLGAETHVVRNDSIGVSAIRDLNPQAIVLSPGPCAPAQAGCCLEVVRELAGEVPMLGVCLGHEVIAEAFGGHIIRANEPVHGRASVIHHDDTGTFVGLPSSFLVGRYHSLVAERKSLPDCLRVNAWLPDDTVMAITHREHPVVGWQFHPESVLTEHGYALLAAFLSDAGFAKTKFDSVECSRAGGELHLAIPKQPDWFARAIEFPGNSG